MKLTIRLEDNKFEQLEEVAKANGMGVEHFITSNVDHLLRLNPREHQLLLNAAQLAAISAAHGGKLIQNGDEVVRLVTNALSLNVGDAKVTMAVEDANALREQFASTRYASFEKYVEDSVNEALSVYLWGSTRGVLTY